MRVVIAPDKFKGSLSAAEAARAMAAGILAAHSQAEIDLCPMADGGEGTVAAMVAATGGQLLQRMVTGPLAEMKVNATFGVLGDGNTAVIEMAAASGLALLRADDRHPLNTTTFGTGELLRHVAEMGLKKIILGIGGSATCEAGIGAAQGAGLTVLMRDGSPVSPTEPLAALDLDEVLMVKHARGSPVDGAEIIVACDVNNPLCGPDGAARVFGPQKGATPAEVEELDRLLRELAHRLGKNQEANIPGAGAAGGLGFGMMVYFGAMLQPGVEMVMNAVGLRQRLHGADWCITGEGKIDRSTLGGKVPAGVARLCREMGVRCAALGGVVEHAKGLENLFNSMAQIKEPGMSHEYAIANAAEWLEQQCGKMIF